MLFVWRALVLGVIFNQHIWSLPSAKQLSSVRSCIASGGFADFTEDMKDHQQDEQAPMPPCVTQCPSDSVAVEGNCANPEVSGSQGARFGFTLEYQCKESDACRWFSDASSRDGMALRTAQLLRIPHREVIASHVRYRVADEPGSVLKSMYIVRRGEPGFLFRRLAPDSDTVAMVYISVRADSKRISENDLVVQELLGQSTTMVSWIFELPMTVFNTSFQAGVPPGGVNADYRFVYHLDPGPWIHYALPTRVPYIPATTTTPDKVTAIATTVTMSSAPSTAPAIDGGSLDTPVTASTEEGSDMTGAYIAGGIAGLVTLMMIYVLVKRSFAVKEPPKERNSNADDDWVSDGSSDNGTGAVGGSKERNLRLDQKQPAPDKEDVKDKPKNGSWEGIAAPRAAEPMEPCTGRAKNASRIEPDRYGKDAGEDLEHGSEPDLFGATGDLPDEEWLESENSDPFEPDLADTGQPAEDAGTSYLNANLSSTNGKDFYSRAAAEIRATRAAASTPAARTAADIAAEILAEEEQRRAAARAAQEQLAAARLAAALAAAAESPYQKSSSSNPEGASGRKAGSTTASVNPDERRKDTMLGGRFVSFAEMCRGHAGEGLSEGELLQLWTFLRPAGQDASSTRDRPSARARAQSAPSESKPPSEAAQRSRRSRPARTSGAIDMDDIQVDVFESIDLDLREMKGAPLPQRKAYFQQQCLRWHPDKNPQDAERAKQMFQHLQERKSWFLS